MDMGIKQPFSFESLLKPYLQAGTETNPLERSLGGIIDWLVNKYQYPVDIVGGAMLIVFTQLYHDQLKFPDDGSYGNQGHQLDNCIRAKCDELYRLRLRLEQERAIFEKSLVVGVTQLLKRTWKDKFNYWMRWGKWR